MGKPESFPGEKCLNRAILRLQTGIQKPFMYLGHSYILEKFVDYELRHLTSVTPVDGHYQGFRSHVIFEGLTPSSLSNAINTILVNDVVSS